MPYQDLPAHKVSELLAQPDAVVLDVRDAGSYARGHLDGARPAEEAVVSALVKQRRKDPPVLIYCYHGNSSRELATFLAGIGFSRVYNLEGGWAAWEALLAGQDAAQTTALPAALHAWAAAHGFAAHSLDSTDINSRSGNGMTPLMTAAREGCADLALALLEAGAEPNLVNDDGNNALWFACYSAQPELLHGLIARGVDLDNRNVNGATCLIYAASAGKFEVVQILVEAGADLAPVTHDGFNALDSAASLAVLKYLRPRYAQVPAGQI